MHINFDTSSLQPQEALGLIALLNILIPHSVSTFSNLTDQTAPQVPQAPAPSPRNEREAIFGVPILTAADPVVQLQQSIPNPQPAPGAIVGPVTPIVPAPAGEPTKRHRRTKAEIAADEAAAKQALAGEPTKRHRRTKAEIAAEEAAAKQALAGHPEILQPATQPTTTTQTATEPTTTSATAKPLTAEELRALLNGYIARHSMEEAIGKLREFGCNRVTEALALEPVKLNVLAEALRG